MPDPGDLVGVRRADAAPGGADLVRAEEALGDLVDGLVVRRDDVGVGADDEPGDVDAASGQPVELTEEGVGRDDDTVADHGGAARGQDAAGQQVGRELLAVDDDGVAGVVAAAGADDVVDLLGGGEQVGGLALALVAPLGSEDHDRGHRGTSTHDGGRPAGLVRSRPYPTGGQAGSGLG